MPKVKGDLTTLAEKLAKALLQKKWRVALAESCTGGGIAYTLTSIPGSSEWFDRGFVTYSNVSKQEQLKVTSETLKQFGAVSEQTVKEMAEGALQQSHADVSIAVTGVAGPDGGSAIKPVGTVWFGFASKVFSTAVTLEHFAGDRENIRLQAIEFALKYLLSLL